MTPITAATIPSRITQHISEKLDAQPLRQDERIDALMEALERSPKSVHLPGYKVAHKAKGDGTNRPLPTREAIIRLAVRWALARDIDPVKFLGRTRVHSIAHSRQDLWRWLYENTNVSYPYLADVFGREHTGIREGVKASARREKQRREKDGET